MRSFNKATKFPNAESIPWQKSCHGNQTAYVYSLSMDTEYVFQL